MTHALRVLASHGVAHTCHEYRYVAHGGTAEAARQLGVDEHSIVKTLVLGSDEGQTPTILLMLMHGDAEVSTRALARAVGARAIAPCAQAVAERVTGYQVRRHQPVRHSSAIAGLRRGLGPGAATVFINGGRRGLLVELSPAALLSVLKATPVQARAGSNP
jgi:Cys-tRNA(Pro) deacylase